MEARGPQVVLVHDWLTGMRGGEKCLEVLCRRWPQAAIYTLLHNAGSVTPVIERRPLITSFLNYLPAVERYYRYLLPLMPAAVSNRRLPPCDLVVSLSHCVAKSARPPRGVPHVCYCFTPMRYAWHQRRAYFGRERLGWLKALLASRLLKVLRDWDRRTAAHVTHFVAISRTVQRRIRDCYGRSSVVIHPPVDTKFYTPAPVRRGDYYLTVSAFAPYKRLDLAIAACNRLRRPLVIIGSGQDANRLRGLAGPTVHFLGWQPDTVLRDHYRRCRALLFPGEEDFGLVPIEAQACGAPVIAFGRGGATETVIPLSDEQRTGPIKTAPPTGLWFEDQSTDCLIAALQQFELCSEEFDPVAIRRQAQQFSKRRFEEEFFAYLETILGKSSLPIRQAA